MRKKDFELFEESPFKVGGKIDVVRTIDLGWVDWVNMETGEVSTLRARPKKVTSTKDTLMFKKVFNDLFPVLRDIRGEGAVLLLWVIMNVKIGKDYVDLEYDDCKEWCKFNSRQTYHRGLLALLDKKVIAMSSVRNRYFINVNLFYNGKRKL